MIAYSRQLSANIFPHTSRLRACCEQARNLERLRIPFYNGMRDVGDDAPPYWIPFCNGMARERILRCAPE